MIINKQYDAGRCHGLLVNKNGCQCKRKKPQNGVFCKTHARLWESTGLKTIYSPQKTPPSFKRVNLNYNIDNLHKLTKIQKLFRGRAVRDNIKNRGICMYARHLCNNLNDCMELKDIFEIPNNVFFSYKDSDNLYWGFHIETFDSIIKYNMTNPYNLAEISEEIKKRFNHLHNTVDTIKTKCVIKDKYLDLQEKCITIFQKIDSLNNYTKCSWFLDLSSSALKKMYYFLFDLWNYRLNLSESSKHKYLTTVPLFKIKYEVFKKYTDYYKIAHIILDIFDRLVSEGNSESDKNTAANWVLSVLTLVNSDARNALPWLYQAAFPG